MFIRPKNRRKPSEARRRLPAINWRYLGLWVLALAALAAAASAVSWAFDQPIETVAVAGRFQRVAPVDVGRGGKEKVHGAGPLSVDLREGRHVPPELAQLAGPDGKESLVAQRYLAAEGRLSQAGLRLTALRLDARGAWEFDLANGVTVRLGRRQVDERFEKFMNTALKLVTQRGEDIAYVDMRYTNGFAIGWRGNAAGAAGRDGGHDA